MTGGRRSPRPGRMAVAVAVDGTWLATASYDQTVRIWDAATGSVSALMRVDRT
jgi:WD40 repeat protein